MIRGIRYQEGMDVSQLEIAGFTLVEYDYGKSGKAGFQQTGFIYSQEMELYEKEEDWLFGVSVIDDELEQVLENVSDLGIAYLVLETVGMEDRTNMSRHLEMYAEKIKISGIKVYIENGYCFGANGIIQSAFSEVDVMKELVDRLNLTAKADCFGICLNIGHANLLGKNVCGMIERLGHHIGLIHAGDNDGITSQCQMPYTFTRGRGELSTDWYGIIGALAMWGFKGAVVYDIAGLFEVSPARLRPGWYRLLSAVAREWEGILELEEYLKKTSKKERSEADSKASVLVLFGAGRMFHNYMEVWGNAYPPSFIVDNNETLWGGTRENICIRPPSALLEDKEHPTFVLICNMYYASIEKQLDIMGIRWRKYDDKYFFRYQNLVDKQGAGIC